MSENRVFCPMNFAIMKLWALRLRIQTNPLWDIPISLVSIHVSFTVLNYGYSMIYFNIQSDICLGIWKKLSQRANFPRNPGTHRWSSHFLLSTLYSNSPLQQHLRQLDVPSTRFLNGESDGKVEGDWDTIFSKHTLTCICIWDCII